MDLRVGVGACNHLEVVGHPIPISPSHHIHQSGMMEVQWYLADHWFATPDFKKHLRVKVFYLV